MSTNKYPMQVANGIHCSNRGRVMTSNAVCFVGGKGSLAKALSQLPDRVSTIETEDKRLKVTEFYRVGSLLYTETQLNDAVDLPEKLPYPMKP